MEKHGCTPFGRVHFLLYFSVIIIIITIIGMHSSHCYDCY